MAQERGSSPGLTVGSLLGFPLGASVASADVVVEAVVEGGDTPAALPAPPPGEMESASWVIVDGHPAVANRFGGFRADGVEALSFNNPFGQNLERVWFDGKLVFALDVGSIDVDETRVKVAQEYQIVYTVELDQNDKLRREPELVERQYNIYDSVPGMEIYSPIWQFNYVVVPRGYVPNSLRSARDCEQSGYPIQRSRVFEN